MGKIVNRSQIADGVFFTAIYDDKFKGNGISVNFVVPLCNETASKYAVLPFMLRKGFRSCPDSAQFSRLLNSMYGASCSFSVTKAGDDQILSLLIEGIDDRYTIGNEKITCELAKILCSLVLDPVIEDGAFSQKLFENEKKSLIDAIKAELNDKVALASQKCQQTMFEGHSAAIGKYGSLESAQALDCREVFDAYNDLLSHAKIEIIFSGSGDSEGAKEIFSSAFTSCVERKKVYDTGSRAVSGFGGIKEKTEEYSINQAKLSLGFTTECSVGDEDEMAMNFMCALFGGTPFSKLFLNVREKLSLCYYCSASFDKFKGAIFVNSGVESENREKAQSEILSQLESIQNGDITDDEIENTRKLLKNACTSVSDDMMRIMLYYIARLCTGRFSSPEEDIEAYSKVGREDIINAARKVKLNTVYFMAPKGEN